MDYIQIVLTSLFSLVALFILTKLVGNKQISELTIFDYVIGISIGSIAAEMATELEKPLKPLTAMAVYAVVSYIISVITSKSLKLRRILFGHSIVLMRNGKLYRKNLKKGHIDLSEFLMQCRTNGYFDISAINTAVLEPSGKISFMPFPNKRPVTAEDIKTVPVNDDIFFNVIMDGQIFTENLTAAGKDINWLKNELKAQGIKKKEDVFLATLDTSGTLNVFKNNDYFEKNDFFD